MFQAITNSLSSMFYGSSKPATAPNQDALSENQARKIIEAIQAGTDLPQDPAPLYPARIVALPTSQQSPSTVADIILATCKTAFSEIRINENPLHADTIEEISSLFVAMGSGRNHPELKSEFESLVAQLREKVPTMTLVNGLYNTMNRTKGRSAVMYPHTPAYNFCLSLLNEGEKELHSELLK